jgi:hypothetical protein
VKGLSSIALVSRSMARLVWPGEDPVGRTFVVAGFLTVRVIGVGGDVKARGLRSDDAAQAYFPFGEWLAGQGYECLLVRAAGDPTGLLAPIRARLDAIDPTLALVQPRTMLDVVSDGMAETSLQTWLLSIFAALALILAAVGLYSVMAFLVVQRRQEMGVRVALSASRSDLLRLVLSHAAKLVGTGVAFGLCAALR